MYKYIMRNRRCNALPMSSNGRVVPRPSEQLVPSNRQVPTYASAVVGVGMLGEGGTQGSPLCAHVMPRRHPAMV